MDAEVAALSAANTAILHGAEIMLGDIATTAAGAGQIAVAAEEASTASAQARPPRPSRQRGGRSRGRH